jgi:hypothetical protein
VVKNKEAPVSPEVFKLIQWILDPKVIDGALRSAIHAHGMISSKSGPIRIIEKDAKGNDVEFTVSTCSTSSASKRIRGAVRTRIEEYLANEAKKVVDKPKPKWYSKVLDLIDIFQGRNSGL